VDNVCNAAHHIHNAHTPVYFSDLEENSDNVFWGCLSNK
jgi:hypothetical protein